LTKCTSHYSETTEYIREVQESPANAKVSARTGLLAVNGL